MGHLEVVRFLCDAGANKNEAKTKASTPLFIASGLGHFEVVRFLCGAGAHTNQATAEGRTPLYVACTQLHFKVEFVLRNAGAEHPDPLWSGVKRRRLLECVGCSKQIRLQAFDAERLSFLKICRDITKHAKCKACCANPSEEAAEVECVGCRKQIPLQAFDAERQMI